MKKILILGAGKSSAHLIRYLASHAERLHIELEIADIHISQIDHNILNSRVRISQIALNESNPYESLIKRSDIVVSMLPATMHFDIAKICLQNSKHLITPSYISENMKLLHEEAVERGLIFLNEMGFDPGIDHMTTMKIYHELESKGALLKSYRSYAGGLVAPDCDTNPWNYKFSWNPRNVILAGQGGEIQYRRNGNEVHSSYSQLFADAEKINFRGEKLYDAYANRDSLKYEELYGWKNMQTLLRGTLRGEGFCEGWNYLIRMGLTDNTRVLHFESGTSLSEFYGYFHGQDLKDSPLKEVYIKLKISDNPNLQEKLGFIGLWDSDSKIRRTEGTAAEILQSVLEEKWELESRDRDLVIMIHILEYEQAGRRYEIESTSSLEGEDAHYTAMSKTVGLPIAMACEMIIENQIAQRGVIMPISKDIYSPLLEKLALEGIHFMEKTKEI